MFYRDSDDSDIFERGYEEERNIVVKAWDVSVYWELEEYHDTLARINIYKPYSSYCTHFELSDSKWCLEIETYFEADANTSESDWMSLALRKIGPSTQKDHVAVTLGINTSDGSVYKSYSFDHAFSLAEKRGCIKFMKNSVLRERSNNILNSYGSVNLFCNVRLLERSPWKRVGQTLTTDGSVALVQNLADMFLSGRHSDITINVEGQDFKGHKSILAVRSPVFASMFEPNKSVKQSGIVNVTGCDPNSFRIFLLSLYTGKFDGISSDNVYNLYKTARNYDFKGMTEECVQFIIRDLSVISVCDAIRFAVLHDESDLLNPATDFFISNVKHISRTEDWQILMKDNPTLANELLCKTGK